VGIVDGRVVALGSPGDVRRRLGGRAELLAFPGATILPGLIDPHVHLFAMAARFGSLDCGRFRRTTEVLRAVAQAASLLPPGAWVRGHGLDETALGRLPTGAELDRAAPRNPVRLRHRSRHASVLSGMALASLGTRLPGSAVRSDGLVVGRERLVGRASGAPPAAVIADGLARVSRALLRRGVTTVGDATPRSGRGWGPVREQMAAGRFHVRVSGMRAVGGRPWPAGERLWPGPVKILVEEEGTTLRPRPQTLVRIVARAAAAGDRIAVHCLGAATLAAALAAFEAVPRRLRPRWQHRLEHVAECPLPFVQQVAALGLMVVTNPVFVATRGDVYRRETDPALQPWLYRAGSFTRAGVPVAAASDAPIGACDPWAGMAAARARRTRAGARLGWRERVSADMALALVTTNAALALGRPALGRLAIGGPADLLVVDRDPVTTRAADVGDTEVLLTMVAGEIAWRA